MQRLVESVAKQVFDAPERVLWVGKTGKGAGPELWSVPDPESARALPQAPEGAVWLVEGDFLEGLAVLRECLRPGATLLLGVRLVPTLGSSVRALVSRRRLTRFSCEAVCESLLLAGLREPRVWQESGKLLCISVRTPTYRDPLDACLGSPFESAQPRAAS
jgi:hypothetical protein